MKKSARYSVGIDLGTTNSVVSYVEADPGRPSEIRIFKVPQLTGSGVVDNRDVLPSFLYLKTDHERSGNSLRVPFQSGCDPDIVAGEFARDRGVEVPHRLISSSKSWLCNEHVDRESPILPWESPDDVRKISPLAASGAIVSHIRDAWNAEMAAGNSDLRLENQDVYLTVPASFDAVARELTVKAARLAGLEDITLIEEPQAAFYAWIERSKDQWREKVTRGDLILVCDIGGGTSDFSLIEVTEDDQGKLALERVAVGDHLLVGGDNIDLALSYFLAARLQAKGQNLDSWQMRGLVHSCRKAKEVLFSSAGETSCPVTILGRGSFLIRGTIKTVLNYDEVGSVVADGFFPECSLDEKPKIPGRSGIKDFGLVYESDPGITRHLARFLSSRTDAVGQVRLPTAVLFNGGVMKSNVLRTRVRDLLSAWNRHSGKNDIREIETVDFDLSVARGAAYYGRTLQGDGVRIRGGLGRSYYLSIEASMPAVPGIRFPTRALCIAPFGMEEGAGDACAGKLFNLVVGEPVKFDIMTSSTRHGDRIGTIVDGWEAKDIRAVTTIETILDGNENSVIPVTVQVRLTEVGTLEFWACSRDDDRKWKLELNVRLGDQG
ncbi:MAG: Hsp70 family protein [Pseudomonadota bacterium]